MRYGQAVSFHGETWYYVGKERLDNEWFCLILRHMDDECQPVWVYTWEIA